MCTEPLFGKFWRDRRKAAGKERKPRRTCRTSWDGGTEWIRAARGWRTQLEAYFKSANPSVSSM